MVLRLAVQVRARANRLLPKGLLLPILIRRPFFVVFVFISIIRTVFVTGLIAVTKVDLLGLVELIEVQTAEQVLQVGLAFLLQVLLELEELVEKFAADVVQLVQRVRRDMAFHVFFSRRVAKLFCKLDIV